MIRSSLSFYGIGWDVERVCAELQRRLSRKIPRSAIRGGVVNRERARKHRVKPLPPKGQVFVTIDLARTEESRRHHQLLSRRLASLDAVLGEVPELSTDPRIRSLLDLTIGPSDDAIYRIILDREIVEILERWRIEVRMDVIYQDAAE